MRKRLSWLAASLLLVLMTAAAVPARAATILERTLEIDIRPDGTILEHDRFAVRLDAAADYGAWSDIPVYLDENRTLEDLDAFAVTPQGQRVKVTRRDRDTVEFAGEGEIHSSRKAKLVSFPVVPPGSVLNVESRVREVPYFPSDLVLLSPFGSEEPIEKLRVEVRGAGPGWRWRLDGPRDGLTVTETAGGVVVTGASVPHREPPEMAPGDADLGPVLRFAWGDMGKTWRDVGRWYEGLLAQVPRAAEPVRREARGLAAKFATPREKLAALLAFDAKQVRYVAVEVGIGGYRPTPPDKVLDRRWGDCKDKALLLVDLLREVGIEAYPALIRLAPDDRIDPDFPAPDRFNHVIVAVKADGVALPGDPVSEGLLFVDPTDETGSVRWLHPGVQDQDALVVRGDQSELVRTPIRESLEETHLAVDLQVEPDGGAQGQAKLIVQGDLGATFAQMIAASRPQDVEHAVRTVLSRLLPGADLSQVQWTVDKADIPGATVSAKVHLSGLLPPGTSTSFALPAFANTPSTGLLQDRTVPLILRPGADRVSWRITLPQGACLPKPDEQKVANDLGEFRHTVSLEGRVVKIDRSLDLRQRWVDPACFGVLKELALAEQRSAKRRIRLECPGG